MPITINGSGTVTGISAGGLPDGVITAPDLNGAQTGTAPIYGCRAWVNFDGTRNEADTGASTNGANVKIRASGNVTSVLKNGVGDYTVNFTTAMADANYAVNITGSFTGVTSIIACRYVNTASAQTSSLVRIGSTNGSTGTATDDANVCVAIFR